MVFSVLFLNTLVMVITKKNKKITVFILAREVDQRKEIRLHIYIFALIYRPGLRG